MEATQVRELHKIAEGREAEIYAWQDGTVLRLLRDAGAAGRQRLQREAAAMAAAVAAGAPAPVVREIITVEGRAGLVMQRVDGQDLLTAVGRRPWTLFRAARITGELHAQLNAVHAPEALPTLRNTVSRRIRSLPLPEHLADFALAALEGLPDGDALCHGDFHPGNIIAGADGPVVIDWPNVTRGDPDADFARTLLMLRLGEPPPGSPLVIRYFANALRGLFVRGYTRAYIVKRRPDMNAVTRWAIVRAADRLAEGIESERAPLLQLLERRHKELQT